MSSAAQPPAGLCTACRHAHRVESRRSSFLRCARADGDPRFARYPRLPVVACAGYEPPEAEPHRPEPPGGAGGLG